MFIILSSTVFVNRINKTNIAPCGYFEPPQIVRRGFVRYTVVRTFRRDELLEGFNLRYFVLALNPI